MKFKTISEDQRSSIIRPFHALSSFVSHDRRFRATFVQRLTHVGRIQLTCVMEHGCLIDDNFSHQRQKSLLMACEKPLNTFALLWRSNVKINANLGICIKTNSVNRRPCCRRRSMVQMTLIRLLTTAQFNSSVPAEFYTSSFVVRCKRQFMSHCQFASDSNRVPHVRGSRLMEFRECLRNTNTKCLYRGCD